MVDIRVFMYVTFKLLWQHGDYLPNGKVLVDDYLAFVREPDDTFACNDEKSAHHYRNPQTSRSGFCHRIMSSGLCKSMRQHSWRGMKRDARCRGALNRVRRSFRLDVLIPACESFVRIINEAVPQLERRVSDICQNSGEDGPKGDDQLTCQSL